MYTEVSKTYRIVKYCRVQPNRLSEERVANYECVTASNRMELCLSKTMRWYVQTNDLNLLTKSEYTHIHILTTLFTSLTHCSISNTLNKLQI